jgi:hypothetical protein
MDTVSRKHLLAQAAALMGGAAALGVDPAQAAPATLPVYRLDNRGGVHTAGCVSCSACTGHADHKYFATAADADLDRAHPYCVCRVIKGRELPYDQWVALFGVPGSIARASVDDRTPWVAEVLASTPPPPGPEQHPPLHVRVLRARVQGRLIAIDLKLTQAARIHVRIASSTGRKIGSRWVSAPSGISRKGLRIPNGAPAGRCRLTFVLHPASGYGPSRTFTRDINVA